MANSISKILGDIINNDLSLQDALHRGYGNYSAIARMLKPKVEEMLERSVKLESVITSVKRVRVGYRPLQKNVAKIVAGSIINIRTGVAKISVEKTERELVAIRKTLTKFFGGFFHVIEGISTITLIFDQKF